MPLNKENKTKQNGRDCIQSLSFFLLFRLFSINNSTKTRTRTSSHTHTHTHSSSHADVMKNEKNNA